MFVEREYNVCTERRLQLQIKRMPLGPLETNGYIVYNDDQAIIIDPGGDAEKVIAFLTEEGINPQAILLTHGHFDHIGGVDKLRKYFGIRVYIHEYEAHWLSDPQLNGSKFFLSEEIAINAADFLLEPGFEKIGPFHFEVVHTLGHSPGSVSFIFHEQSFIISGDVLFNRGIGRTDLPGGDMETLKQSIRNHLYTLSDSFIVYPGHGPETTIGAEKTFNPFVKQS